MNPGTGTLAVLAAKRHPVEVLAAVTPWLPRSWSVRAIATSWGTLLLGGPSTLVENHLMVGGAPVSHPWGVPIGPLDLRVLLDRYARYGLQVTQLAAGPFVVADSERGSFASALNGIVPVFIGRGERTTVGTHGQMVKALSGCSDIERVPAGAVAHVDGTIQDVAALAVREKLPLVDLGSLEKEIAYHVGTSFTPWRPRTGPFAAVAHRFGFRRSRGSLIVLPRLQVLQDSSQDASTLSIVRQEVGELWWEASMRSTSLFVPAFERPALDTFNLAMGRR